MLNSVNQETSSQTSRPERARRLTRDERSRQLLGIGLRFLTERPIQEVSLDEVAREAGISRSLLFHYFPSKTAFYEEVVAAAGRRIARNVRPDGDASGLRAIEQFLDRFIAQVDRRRELYLALVHGSLAELGSSEVLGSLHEVISERARADLETAGLDVDIAVVSAWVAYVEDLIIRWSGLQPEARRLSAAQLRRHCLAALQALGRVPLLPGDLGSMDIAWPRPEQRVDVVTNPEAAHHDSAKESHAGRSH